MDERVQAEFERREALWSGLLGAGGPTAVSSTLLRKLGIYGGAQGVWMDKATTTVVTPDGRGVTVGVLHTGSSYADDLASDGVIYHYPRTNRSGHDASEIEATKAAAQLGLPIFVVTYPTRSSSKRNVAMGWVEDWDDASSQFLISFGDRPRQKDDENHEQEQHFELVDTRPQHRREVAVRDGQQRFKFKVVKRYGARCAVCSIAVPELLDAAHIYPKVKHGSNDPRNGLVLCATHHRAFDNGLFGIDPATLEIRTSCRGPDARALSLTCVSLHHLLQKPHVDAIRWHWERWRYARGHGPTTIDSSDVD